MSKKAFYLAIPFSAAALKGLPHSSQNLRRAGLSKNQRRAALWACLTTSLVPFGRSGRVAHTEKLNNIDNFSPFLKNVDTFWPFWPLFFYHFWQILTNFDNVKPILTIFYHFWQCLTTFDNFLPFLIELLVGWWRHHDGVKTRRRRSSISRRRRRRRRNVVFLELGCNVYNMYNIYR